MKFNSFASQYDIQKALGKVPSGMSASRWYDEWAEYMTSEVRRMRNTNQFSRETARKYIHSTFAANVQRVWHDDVRPYYKLYPCIHEALMKIPLDIPMQEAAIPYGRVVAIRLSAGGELHSVIKGEKRPIGAMLVSTLNHSLGADSTVMSITAQTGKSRIANQSDGAIVSFDLSKPGTFEDRLNTEVNGFADELKPMTRIAVGVLLMANDPSIITAEVLSKDRRRYEETGDQRYIEKAKRRGIVGWSIGQQYETCPHYRRPHFGIRHTGKGRTIPRIVPIKGAVVHSKKLTTVPTGYITPTGVEVEEPA